ncbi:MAG: glycosyltransferase, partial [Bacteroidales bacterium]|nr:glycosyltransferase [Bacteroidales bacterium]
MRILFVSSGKAGDVGHVVRNQGESLKRSGEVIEYLTIDPGIKGYLEAISRIRRAFRVGGYDLVHAHYSLSAISATLAGARPLVVSLMGSDAFTTWPVRLLIRLLSANFWDVTIVKTEEMKSRMRLREAHIVPNGVDLERFVPVEQEFARKVLNLPVEKKIIVFVSVKNRPEKNLPLAANAVRRLNDTRVELIHLHDRENSEIAMYLSAAD